MNWIVENRELLQTIITLLAGGLATFLAVRAKYDRDWKAAFTAALQAATEMAKQAIEGAEEDVIKDVAGEIWDAMLSKSFLATIWSKARFQDFVWASWQKLAIARAKSSVRLANSGRISFNK